MALLYRYKWSHGFQLISPIKLQTFISIIMALVRSGSRKPSLFYQDVESEPLVKTYLNIYYYVPGYTNTQIQKILSLDTKYMGSAFYAYINNLHVHKGSCPCTKRGKKDHFLTAYVSHWLKRKDVRPLMLIVDALYVVNKGPPIMLCKEWNRSGVRHTCPNCTLYDCWIVAFHNRTRIIQKIINMAIKERLYNPLTLYKLVAFCILMGDDETKRMTLFTLLNNCPHMDAESVLVCRNKRKAKRNSIYGLKNTYVMLLALHNLERCMTNDLKMELFSECKKKSLGFLTDCFRYWFNVGNLVPFQKQTLFSLCLDHIDPNILSFYGFPELEQFKNRLKTLIYQVKDALRLSYYYRKLPKKNLNV